MLKSIFIGSATSVAATFPIAASFALLYRFPVPFRGYVHGTGGVWPAIEAVVFYGWDFRGFVALALLGGMGGALVQRFSHADQARRTRVTVILATVVALAAVLCLAVLDKLIGPW